MTDAELSDLYAKATAAIENQYPEFSMTPAAVRALIDENRELKRIQAHQVREYAKEVLTNQILTADNQRMRKALESAADYVRAYSMGDNDAQRILIMLNYALAPVASPPGTPHAQ